MQTAQQGVEKIILSAYSEKLKVQLLCSTKGRTKQSFKDECDINTIIRRFLRTGVLDFANKNEARYGDCTGQEFQQAMLTVAGARSLFNELPAELRNRFENDPAQFLDFVQDDANREEARELGLLKPEAAPAGEPATPPAPAPAAAPTEAPAAA